MIFYQKYVFNHLNFFTKMMCLRVSISAALLARLEKDLRSSSGLVKFS